MKEKEHYEDVIDNDIDEFDDEDYEEYDEDQDYDIEEYFYYEELNNSSFNNYEEKYIQYQPERTSSFHNFKEYSRKRKVDNITHKEISRDIKEISRNTYIV